MEAHADQDRQDAAGGEVAVSIALENTKRRRGGYKRSPEQFAWTQEMWTCPKCDSTMKRGGMGPHSLVCGKPDPMWERVEKEGHDGCWVFTGARDKWGYGDLQRRGKHVQAHRWAWKLLRGDPGKLDCLHTCHNPSCCNPDHLYLGTDVENGRDRAEAGRSVRGERVHTAKLTEEKVREIRKRREDTGESYDRIALDYGVSSSVVRAACLREYWSHVE